MLHTWIRPILVLALSTTPLLAQVRPFGTSCAGPLSRAPSLTTDRPPVANSKFDLVIDTVKKNASHLLVFGVSNTKWSGVPLPIDMKIFGFPGCFLNIEYLNVFGLGSNSSGLFTITIPPLAPGGEVFAQVFVPDPKGMAVSQGYELRVVNPVKPFSLIVVPDTQSYVYHKLFAPNFTAMMKWIADNTSKENIKFVSHVGDIVQDGATGAQNNKVQWDRAEAALDLLDGDLKKNPNGIVPYSASIGNRDYDALNVKSSAATFDKRFGPTRFNGRSWYGGSSKNGRNSFQLFSSGGEYLHLSLEWRADDDALAWARQILAAHPKTPTVLTTHQYLGGYPPTYDISGATPDSSGDNAGAEIYHKLVETHPQIFLVLCGHNAGGIHRTSTTIFGQTVFEILSDYSFDANGGNGWMNRVEFRPDSGEIVNKCFSPTFRPGITKGINRNYLPTNNFKKKFDFHAHRRWLETIDIRRFINGVDYGHGSAKGLDTFVSRNAPNLAYGSDRIVSVDNSVATDERHGLLRFDNIFGTQANQIPRDKRIAKAILTLTTEGSGSTSNESCKFYQLQVPFDEASTWNSLKNGIQIGTETVSKPVTETGKLVAEKGTRSFDVTASLRSWQAGAKNHGWAIINPGSDFWSFRSGNWTAIAERPMLTVILEVEP